MDRPVTFSPAMVQALLAGRKTQTRRLASSPLRQCQPGDRLYVREHWKTMAMHDKVKPVDLGPKYAKSVYGRADACPVSYLADGELRGEWPDERSDGWSPGKHRQAMHMPRWASRMTLVIDQVRIEPVQSITAEDAKAEGVVWNEPTEEDRRWAARYAAENGGSAEIDGVWTVPGVSQFPGTAVDIWHVTPADCYGGLWNMLHPEPPHRFADNPMAVALTFRIINQNIDRIPA